MNNISTRNVGNIPTISNLKRLLKSLATLDAIMSPEWSYRLYSYNERWGEGEEMGSMRNGSGDELFVLFNSSGCFIKGFDHESAMSSWSQENGKSWPGVVEQVPSRFQAALNEPAFSPGSISFCLWRNADSNSSWTHGDIEFPDGEDPDGSEYLLEILDGDPKTYQQFALDYYESELELTVIAHIYNHAPLTQELVGALNSEINLSQLESDLMQIGYPVAVIK